MADQLEKYINEHRSEFDAESPSSEAWKNIRDGLGDERANMNTAWYWKAAAVMLLMLSTYLIVDKVSQSDSTTPFIAQLEEPEDEFVMAEDYYFSVINQKIVEIQESELSPEIKKDFTQEIQRLDEMYSELQLEYQQVQDEKIKDAMILNLQLRINLLNEQLNIIRNIKTIKEDENTSA